jgi:hypothetical protein
MTVRYNLRLTAVVAVLAIAVTGCSQSASTTSPQAPEAAKAAGVPADGVKISREQPLNASPLGIEVGFANLQGVKQKIGSLTTLKSEGTNQFSGGEMLVSNGEGLGVGGLTSAAFIFNKSGTLAGVVMTLPKKPADMFEILSKKYKAVDNKIDPSMGYGYAKLAKGDCVVEIDADRLSGTMEVRYLTNQLLSDFKKKSSEQEAQKKQGQPAKM